MDHPFFLAIVILSFALFGCVLGFVSFEETRARRKAQKSQVAAPNREVVSDNAVGFAK
jgi:hypothetical protein